MNIRLLKKLRTKAKRTIYLKRLKDKSYFIYDVDRYFVYNDDYFMDLVSAVKELYNRRREYVIKKAYDIKPQRHNLPY